MLHGFMEDLSVACNAVRRLHQIKANRPQTKRYEISDGVIGKHCQRKVLRLIISNQVHLD